MEDIDDRLIREQEELEENKHKEEDEEFDDNKYYEDKLNNLK